MGEVAFNLNGRYNHAPDFWTPDKKDFGPRLAIAFSPTPSEGFWNKIFGNQKSSIRAGYSLVFDHFGAAMVNIFDTTGSYGLSSHLSNAPGSIPIEDAPRFTTISGVPQSLLPSAPPGGFPAVPASSGNGSFAISWGLDSAIKTPYSHLIDFSVARELRNGSSIELSYVGRLAHRQLAQEDVAMPINLQSRRNCLLPACASTGENGSRQRAGIVSRSRILIGSRYLLAWTARMWAWAMAHCPRHRMCTHCSSAISTTKLMRYTNWTRRIVAEQQYRRRRKLSRVSLLSRSIFRALCVAIGRLLELQRTRSRLPSALRRRPAGRLQLHLFEVAGYHFAGRSDWEIRQAPTTRRS